MSEIRLELGVDCLFRDVDVDVRERLRARLRDLRHRRTYRGTPPAGYFGYDPSFLEDEPQGDTK